MKRTIFALAVMTVTLGVLAGTSEAKHRHSKFWSKNPLPGGHFCYVETVHEHPFGPPEPRLYRTVGGAFYFVGDPTPFGYTGPQFAYYDPHPIAEAGINFGEPAYCYLDGPHYHWYKPAASVQFSFAGGAFFFTGVFDPIFERSRPRYVAINHVYRPIRYVRPVVEVRSAPPGWRGRAVPPGHAKRMVGRGTPVFVPAQHGRGDGRGHGNKHKGKH